MLGITVPDAVLILGAVAALLTAYLGTQKGDSARRQSIAETPPPALGGLMADAATMRDLVEVLKLLVVTLQEGIESSDRRICGGEGDRFRRLIEALAAKEAQSGPKGGEKNAFTP